jgi:hypothetical protein
MDPFVIPARSEVEIECEASPNEPGPFSCPMYINYYDGDYQDLKLTVSGTWIASRSANHVASTPP